MDNPFDEFENQPKKRTTFITVLCILTFIGSGWNVLSGAYSYLSADKTAMQTKTEMQKVMEQKKTTTLKKTDKEGRAIAENIATTMVNSFTPENIRKLSLSEIIGGLLCLSGAFLMWRINKKGYMLYVAGVLLGIIMPFVLFGNNLMGIIMSVVSGFIGLVFCILYGVNLKDMK
jgi:hypothetical protein